MLLTAKRMLGSIRRSLTTGGRALSYQFINDTDGGVDYTWSSIAQTYDFKAGKMSMPFIVADGRDPGELLVGSNSTVYKFSSWEFGSFDPTIFWIRTVRVFGITV